MKQFIEFSINHPFLVGTLVVLACALFFNEMRKGGPSIASSDLTRLVNKEDAIIVDIREKADFAKGHIVDALHIPFAQIKERAPELSKYQNRPLIIVDAMGQYGGAASKILKDAGMTQVMKLKGGINSWQADNLPLVKK